MKKSFIVAAVLCMTGGLYAQEFESLGMKAAALKDMPAAEGIAMPDASKSYIDPSIPVKPIEWVTITGGRFTMGYTGKVPENIWDRDSVTSAIPAVPVELKTFEMSKTAVTVAQYAQCVAQGACTTPVPRKGLFGGTSDKCNWRQEGREDHPINCITFFQAKSYAQFVGAKLPNEAQWEYAAKSRGKDIKYPWGNDYDSDKLVLHGGHTQPVCSKPLGNTEQGLCDIAGNVAQWTRDEWTGGHLKSDGISDDGRPQGYYHNTLPNLVLVRGVSFGGCPYRGGHRCVANVSRQQVYSDGAQPYVGIRLVRE